MSIYGIDENEGVAPTCCEGDSEKSEKTREHLQELVEKIEERRNELGKEGRFSMAHELGAIRKMVEEVLDNI